MSEYNDDDFVDPLERKVYEDQFWWMVDHFLADSAEYWGTERRLVAACTEARRRIPVVHADDEALQRIVDNIQYQYLKPRKGSTK